MLGYIPQFFSEADPRPAKEQINTAYAHGGGWRPTSVAKQFKRVPNGIKYPGDPVYYEIARAKLRDETIILYEHAWLMIEQKDGSWEMARVD
jgi:hypothetical protein